MSNKNKTLYITQAAMIAAIYVVLTIFAGSFGLASGAIQVRISEALCILPIFTPAAIPGLFIGCLLANTLTGCVVWDIVCGSLTTLVAAILTSKLKNTKFLYLLPPIIGNALVVPFVLKYAYGIGDAVWFMIVTVAIGEIISVGGFGYALSRILRPLSSRVFGGEEVRGE